MNNYHDMDENQDLRDMIDNSREVLREAWYESDDSLTEDEEKILVREMKKFNEYGDALFRGEEEDLGTLAKKLDKLTELAQRFLNKNVDEDFDKVTVNRNIKEINKYIDKFKKIAGEVREKEDRLQALYEDIGVVFNRYFDIADRDEVDFDNPRSGNDQKRKNEWHKGG